MPVISYVRVLTLADLYPAGPDLELGNYRFFFPFVWKYIMRRNFFDGGDIEKSPQIDELRSSKENVKKTVDWRVQSVWRGDGINVL